jgi:hypothetical protein
MHKTYECITCDKHVLGPWASHRGLIRLKLDETPSVATGLSLTDEGTTENVLGRILAVGTCNRI